MYIITTRFSIITKQTQSHWRIGRVSFDEYVNQILDDGRLHERANLFFNYVVPSIIENSKIYAIKHILLTSVLLPQWLKDELNKLPKNIFSVHYFGVDDKVDLRSIITETLIDSHDCYGDKDLSYVASIRLDDDDILSPNYFECMSNYLCEQFSGFHVSFSSGICGLFNQTYKKFNKERLVLSALGLAYIIKYDIQNKTILTPACYPMGSHPLVDTRAPTIIDGRNITWIHTQSISSDTFKNIGKTSESIYETLNNKYNLNENIDFKDVEKLFLIKFPRITDSMTLRAERNDIFVSASPIEYNYYREDLNFPDKNITVIFTIDNCSSEKFTYGFYDYSNNCFIKKIISSVRSNEEHELSIDNYSTNKLAFLIYAGLSGHTAGHSIKISNLRVYSSESERDSV